MLRLSHMKPPRTPRPASTEARPQASTQNGLRTGFYKGIPGFTVSDDDLLIAAAEASIYRWWWAFLRLSPVFWYARATGLAIRDAEMARAYELAGDLTQGSFAIWWKRHGRYVFEEAHRPASARVVAIDQPQTHELYQQSIVIEIPLTITRKKILRDIRTILDGVDHRLNALSVIGTSQAKLKLKSKKFNLNTIEHEHSVLVYRILHPGIALWKLGDRLQLAPSNHVRGRVPSDVAAEYGRGQGPFARMQSLTGRYLYKARFARHHAERGSFPNYAKPPSSPIAMPFGSRAHADFIAATSESDVKYSAWQRYVCEEYEKDLHYRIIAKNKLDRFIIRDATARARLPAFVAGQIDLTL
jgi:hypothetical protein